MREQRNDDPRPRPTRATCICCRNLGVLPDTGTRQVYDAAAGEMRDVAPGALVAGEVVLQMCDDCVVAAFLSGGAVRHPHRLSRALTRGRTP